MGGGYYDRDDEENYVPISNVSLNSMPDEDAQKIVKLDPSLDPKRWTSESNYLVSARKNPIVFALDVTGSMGEWTKVNNIIDNR